MLERIYFKDIKPEKQIKAPLLLKSAEEKTAKNGNPFLQVTFSDGLQEVPMNFWSTDAKVPISLGTLEPYIGQVREVSFDFDGKYYTLKGFRKTEDSESFRVDDFVRSAPFAADEMYRFLIEQIQRAKEYRRKDLDEEGALPISDLAIQILEEHKEKLLYWAGAQTHHHNYRSGLLYHLYRMCLMAVATADVYDLDWELLVCGAALHDIGKIYEFETDALGSVDYMPAAALLGHLYIGAELIEKQARKGHYTQERVDLLKHLVVSHHGRQEYGAIVPPAIPEAFALHSIDNMDSQVSAFVQQQDLMEPGTIAYSRPLRQNVYLPVHTNRASVGLEEFEQLEKETMDGQNG